MSFKFKLNLVFEPVTIESIRQDVDMYHLLFLILMIFLEIVVGAALLIFIMSPLIRLAASRSLGKRIFTALGVVVISPVPIPAGTISMVPVPLCVLLFFIRSFEDVVFLSQMWWLVVPSMLLTGLFCLFLSNKILKSWI